MEKIETLELYESLRGHAISCSYNGENIICTIVLFTECRRTISTDSKERLQLSHRLDVAWRRESEQVSPPLLSRGVQIKRQLGQHDLGACFFARS